MFTICIKTNVERLDEIQPLLDRMGPGDYEVDVPAITMRRTVLSPGTKAPYQMVDDLVVVLGERGLAASVDAHQATVRSWRRGRRPSARHERRLRRLYTRLQPIYRDR